MTLNSPGTGIESATEKSAIRATNRKRNPSLERFVARKQKLATIRQAARRTLARTGKRECQSPQSNDYSQLIKDTESRRSGTLPGFKVNQILNNLPQLQD